jgi:DNA mismatch repair protein MutL
MSKIRVLPEVLANKIAAGEVVERPASIAKELVENALDAGAKRVEVEIASAGRSLVRVADDGEGMTRDDAILAFERHATSKLRTVEDLSSIATFGFRGEALPSIAAVSKLTLTTRTPEEVVGTQLQIVGGRLGDVRDVAWPGGTEMAVRDLFFNIPARRKFLKSDSTESYHVANLVTHYALANPGVAFTLVNNGRETIRVSPVGSLRERAYQLLGPALVDRLVEVEAESNGIRISGYVSNPQEQRTSREAQYLFVNSRYVRDRLLGRAIADGFRSMMPSGTYPAAVLFLELSPDRVDVNVHPAKIEVRFREEQVIRQVIGSAIRDALERATRPVTAFPAPEMRASAPPPPAAPREVYIGTARPDPLPVRETPPADAEPFAFEPPSYPATRTEQPHLDLTFRSSVPEPEPLPTPSELPRAGEPGPASHRGLPLVRDEALPDRSGELTGQILPLGQIRDSFIVATDEEGLLLVDQHVAHERILFERFRDARRETAPARQHLLLPETVDLTPAQAAAFERLLPEIEAAGFDVMQLSGRTIAISAVPAELPPTDVRSLLTEILDAADSVRGRESLESVREEIAASLACRAAIKINMRLTDEKMRWLIGELLKSRNPWTCPHGRPVLLRFTIRDIERQFQRPEGYQSRSR